MERLTRRKAIIIAGGVPVLAGLGAYGALEEQAGQSTGTARFERPARELRARAFSSDTCPMSG